MNQTVTNHIKMTNLLLIAGNGRNVGKTFIACKIIEYLSKTLEVTGLKISPHFHDVPEQEILFRNEHFIIVNETQINSKDSSLMVQSGAKKVFFVMVHQGYLHEAFEKLQHFLSGNIIVCESGALREIVTPGLFLFLKRKGEEIMKPQFLMYSPVVVNNDGFDFDFDIERIELKNNEVGLKPEIWESLKR